MLEFVRDVRDADSGSDHFLLITKMWLRFKRLKQAEKQMIFDTAKLKDINIRFRYQLEVRSRFASLEKTNDIEVRWSNFKEWMERIMDIIDDLQLRIWSYLLKKSFGKLHFL